MKIIRAITLSDALLTSSTVPENDYAAWSSGTTYGAGDYCISTATHRIYRSLAGGNINHEPVADTALATPLYWQDYSATNRWKAFDQKVGAQTTRADSINFVITPTSRVNSLVLLNVDAASVEVTMTDPVDGIVFDETYSMISSSGINNLWDYFFEPIVRRHELSITDMPPYANAAISITLTDTGNTAAVGEIVIGLSRSIGTTLISPTVGIRDFSVKEQDEFGDYEVLEREFSDRGNFVFTLPRALTSEVKRLLSSYRATATVYIGDDDIAATIIFGFYEEFDIVLELEELSICNIRIEGLT